MALQSQRQLVTRKENELLIKEEKQRNLQARLDAEEAMNRQNDIINRQNRDELAILEAERKRNRCVAFICQASESTLISFYP